MFTENTQIQQISTKNAHFQKKDAFFCEFCENDARFPWVELVDVRKIEGWAGHRQIICCKTQGVLFLCLDFAGDVFKIDITGVILLVSLPITSF